MRPERKKNTRLGDPKRVFDNDISMRLADLANLNVLLIFVHLGKIAQTGALHHVAPVAIERRRASSTRSGASCHTDRKAASEESPAQTVDSSLTSKVRLANQMCSPLEKYAPAPPRVNSTFLAPLAWSSAIAPLTDSSSPPLTLMPKMSSSSSSLGLMSNGSMAMRSAS